MGGGKTTELWNQGSGTQAGRNQESGMQFANRN